MPKARRKSSGRPRARATDRKPQWLVGNVTTPASANWSANFVEVPLLNLGVAGAPNALEILQIDLVGASNAVTDTFFAIGSASYNGTARSVNTLPNVSVDKRNLTATRTGTAPAITLDFTDEAGNGTLYPGQQIFLNATNIGDTAETWTIRILYRIKKTNLQEYLGIVNQYIVTQL